MDIKSRRETVASYRSYDEAQRAVDLLSDRGFPVEELAIEGRGIRLVERILGRVTYARAALHGAASGATIGVVFGLLFGWLNWFAPAESAALLVLWGVVVGALWGAILGLVGHWMTRGRRDFGSVRSIEADTFEVTAAPGAADDARRLLGDNGLRRVA